jgi:hypothetical protein
MSENLTPNLSMFVGLCLAIFARPKEEVKG